MWWALVLLLGTAPPVDDASVSAQTNAASDAPAAPSDRLRVGLVPALALDPVEMSAVLRSHLAQTGLEAEVELLDEQAAADPARWAASGTPARAVFWLVPDGPDALRLQLWLPGDAGAWSRTLPREADTQALLESIGVMVRTMATSIEPTPTPVASPPPSPVVTKVAPPAPPPRRRTFVDLALGYAGSNVADAAPWHSAVAARAHVVAPFGLTALVGVTWAPPQRATTTPASTLQRIGVELGLGATFRREARVQPWVGGAALIEALGWRVRDVDAGRGWAARIGVAAAGGIDVALSRRVGIVAIGRVDVWAHNANLVVVENARRRTLLRAHPVAGTAWVGVRVRLGRTFFGPDGPSRTFLHPSAARPRHTRG